MSGKSVFNPRFVRQFLRLRIGDAGMARPPVFPVESDEKILAKIDPAEIASLSSGIKAWESVLIEAGAGASTGEITPWLHDGAWSQRKTSLDERVEIVASGELLERRETCEALAEAGAGGFCVGLHGMSAASHDRLAGAGGNFKKTRTALRNLSALRKEKKIQVEIFSLVDANSVGEIGSAIERLHGDEIELSQFARLVEDFFVPEMDVFHFQRARFPESGRPSLRGMIGAFREAVGDRIPLEQAAIYLDYFPFCVMEGLENHVCYQRVVEARIVTDGGAGPVKLLFDNRTHIEKCGGCVYESLCPGIEPDILENPEDLEFVLSNPTPEKAPDDFLRRLEALGVPFPAPSPVFLHPVYGATSVEEMKCRAKLAALEKRLRKSREPGERFGTVFEMAMLSEKIEDNERAIAWLREAKKIAPEEGIARVRLARLLWKTGNRAEAAAEARKAAGLNLTPECRSDLEGFFEAAKKKDEKGIC